MQAGDIVLTPLPQAKGVVKIRPAFIPCDLPPFGDLLLCGISTQLHQQVVGFVEIVSSSDVDFPKTGLKATSLLRLGFLTVLPRSQVAGAIGAVTSQCHRRLLQRLSQYLSDYSQ